MDEICFLRLVLWFGNSLEKYENCFCQLSTSEHNDSLEEKDESEELEDPDMYLQKEVRLFPLSSCFT